MQRLFDLGYCFITIAFGVCGFSLIGCAVFEIVLAFQTLESNSLKKQFDAIIEGIGLLTIAVASLELGQTVLEEEITRKSHISTPTRVRRFLSRFMIVIVVSLAIEFLVTVFELAHNDPAHLPAGAAIGVATALMLVAWGVFIWLNTYAEELEPEAMHQVKQEDIHVGSHLQPPPDDNP